MDLTTFSDYLIYTRGTTEDFDRYAKASGDNGWSWKNMQQYFRKNERFGPPADNRDITGQYDPSLHSFSGINSVSLPGQPGAIDGRIMDATRQLGGKYKYNIDQNSGNSLGVGECLISKVIRYNLTYFWLRKHSVDGEGALPQQFCHVISGA